MCYYVSILRYIKFNIKDFDLFWINRGKLYFNIVIVLFGICWLRVKDLLRLKRFNIKMICKI